MAATLPEFDELNEIRTTFESEILGSLQERKFDRKKCEDIIFDLLTMSYVYGLEVAGLDLETDIPVDKSKMREAVMAKTAGKTVVDRLNDDISRANDGISGEIRQNIKTAESLINELAILAETEAGRVVNEAILEGAEAYARKNPDKTVMKTWVTMADDKVRDPHWVLEGSTVPYDSYFYTDGAKALRPHGFGVPELDINCRCILRLSTQNRT